MVNQTDLSQHLAIDTQGLNNLKRAARDNSPEAVRAVATQFEALFLNMMLKSMRDAGGGEGGLFDNEQSRMYTSMLDQQLSQSLASRGIGLADVLVRQLSPHASSAHAAVPEPGQAGRARLHQALERMLEDMPQTAPAGEEMGGTPVGQAAAAVSVPEHVQAFRQRMMPYAEQASRITGIPAKFILAQAALESGWGKREITGADGKSSHNLFGIKASGSWSGKVVETMTTEYVNGVPHRKTEKFRAYDSYADAFRDYARLISTNPRYQAVIAEGRDAAGFASQMQQAGYATDPDYAAKLARVIRLSDG